MILNAARTGALRGGIHRLNAQSPSEEDLNKNFILIVINNYLLMGFHAFQKNKKKQLRFKRKIPLAIWKWSMKQEERHRAETFLGCQPFYYELRRSYEELCRILKNT